MVAEPEKISITAKLSASYRPFSDIAFAPEVGRRARPRAAPRRGHELDPHQPLLVLCEGLMGYLTSAETERVATTIRALLGDHGGGSWIVS